MVFNINKDAMFLGGGQESLVVLEGLDRRFCDQDVDFALNGIESDGIVSSVRSKNCDRRPRS